MIFHQMPGLGAVEEGAAAGEWHDPVRHAVILSKYSTTWSSITMTQKLITTTFQQMPGLGAVKEVAAASKRHDPVRHAVHRPPGPQEALRELSRPCCWSPHPVLVPPWGLRHIGGRCLI